jgi:purine-nucleoside phosphorylase
MQALRDIIRARAGDAPVTLGLVLGSGLGHLTGAVDGVSIDYADLPGFPYMMLRGHQTRTLIR